MDSLSTCLSSTFCIFHRVRFPRPASESRPRLLRLPPIRFLPQLFLPPSCIAPLSRPRSDAPRPRFSLLSGSVPKPAAVHLGLVGRLRVPLFRQKLLPQFLADSRPSRVHLSSLSGSAFREPLLAPGSHFYNERWERVNTVCPARLITTLSSLSLYLSLVSMLYAARPFPLF